MTGNHLSGKGWAELEKKSASSFSETNFLWAQCTAKPSMFAVMNNSFQSCWEGRKVLDCNSIMPLSQMYLQFIDVLWPWKMKTENMRREISFLIGSFHLLWNLCEGQYATWKASLCCRGRRALAGTEKSSLELAGFFPRKVSWSPNVFLAASCYNIATSSAVIFNAGCLEFKWNNPMSFLMLLTLNTTVFWLGTLGKHCREWRNEKNNFTPPSWWQPSCFSETLLKGEADQDWNWEIWKTKMTCTCKGSALVSLSVLLISTWWRKLTLDAC